MRISTETRDLRFIAETNVSASFSSVRASYRYPGIVATFLRSILFGVLVLWLSAQSTPRSIPRFEDYPVAENWHGNPAPVVITTRAERMFRTRLTEAGKQLPNFAGHYQFAIWGCGSECISGAIIDLETGKVFAPPLANEESGPMHFSVCQSAYENSAVDFRLPSRLVVLRCGLNYSERLNTNVPDAYYFVWDGERFKEILRITAGRKR
jgi:hypothetical protein